MDVVTIEDRKRELRVLLDKLKAHPERDLSAERARIVVLNEMIAAEEALREGA